MLLHILKKDMRRKKSMNMILILFIILATMFLASSVNNLMTISGAVDEFLLKAHTPDILIIAFQGETEQIMEDFLQESDTVKEYSKENMFVIAEEDISILQCAEEPGRKDYKRDNSLSIGTVPEKNILVFDENGELFVLQQGEIAMPRGQAEANHLTVGDRLRLKNGDAVVDVRLATIIKDAVFGPEMMGFKRAFVSQEDYETLVNGSNGVALGTDIYSIMTDDIKDFEAKFQEKQLRIVTMISRDTVELCYLFDMLVAGILIIVSICLILISFLILRFTIVFTLQEDYREIGIMKAIGIKERSIRSIYLVKYLAIAIISAVIGCALSFPFQNLLLKQILINIVASDIESSFYINIACSAGIVIIVLFFCYLSAGKVRRFTAIQAIRNGGNGERYRVKSKLSLHKARLFSTNSFMACNDITSSFRKYIVMTIVFCIGSLLILIPLTAMHTLKDRRMVAQFSVQPSDIYFSSSMMEDYFQEKTSDKIEQDMNEFEAALEKKGLHADVWTELYYSIPCYGDNPQKSLSVFTNQVIGTDNNDYEVIEGSVAVLDNEVMVTPLIAEQLEVGIGDQITAVLNGREMKYVVTGIYEAMINMGQAIRIGQQAKLDYSYLSGFNSMQLSVEEDIPFDELKEIVLETFPDWEVRGTDEYIRGMVGDIMDTLDGVKYLLLGMVLFINILITVLMMKTLSSGEHGEMAMLKSIGFANHSIRGWQVKRILIILGGSVLLGMLLNKLLAAMALKPIFKTMGSSSIHIVSRPFETYLLSPVILFVVTGFAAYLCSGSIRKVDSKEINTME